MNEHRCPRCEHGEIHGTRRTFGERTIEEFYCPNCELLEVADSDQPTYLEVLKRWRKPASDLKT